MKWRRTFVFAILAASTAAMAGQEAAVSLDIFARAAAPANRDARPALDFLATVWKDAYASIVLELAEMSRPPRSGQAAADADPGSARPGTLDALIPDDSPRPVFERDALPAPPPPVSPVRERLLRFLEDRTGKRFGRDFERWHQWVWSLPYEPHPDYALFKGLLYANIDPRMREFFPPGVRADIRLDEIEWGGVVVNGLRPLDYPVHISVADARYLRDHHIVFGVWVNGDARAYPKRILAWHELARDRVGGVELTIVYCTLCGTVIPYESVVGGQLRRLGTSGLLYRSNKLMFDEQTRSLWSTLEGKPVVGPLVGTGLELRTHAAVTTTWGEWRRLHPETTVLSLDTGHRFDYGEGVAYRDYFASDQLMFSVPSADARLANKDEVLVMRLDPLGGGARVPVAISAGFLRRRPVFQAELAGRQLVVVTTRQGANRVYEAGDRRFVRVGPDGRVSDDRGLVWTVTEESLVADAAPPRPRVSAQRAFWFGWHAQFPETVLIK